MEHNAVQYTTSHGPCSYSYHLLNPFKTPLCADRDRNATDNFDHQNACARSRIFSSAPPLPALHRCPCTRQARSVYLTLTFPATPNSTQPNPKQFGLTVYHLCLHGPCSGWNQQVQVPCTVPFTVWYSHSTVDKVEKDWSQSRCQSSTSLFNNDLLTLPERIMEERSV